jgi:hypothetical protein
MFERKSSIARKHHILPECYLKGFAKHRDKPKLYVLDATQQRHFHSAPTNLAAERDFNRVNLAGVAPDALENAYSRFESELAPALERTIVNRGFIHDADRNLVINLICMTAFRNPRLRESTRDFRERTLKLKFDLLTATPERWQTHLKRMREKGVDASIPELNYEELRKIVEEDKLNIDLPNEYHIKNELTWFEKMLPILLARKWSLLRAPRNTSGYVTSDHPVCLMFSNPRHRGGFYSPGFGLAGTDVLFPISKELALAGTFEGEEREFDLNDFGVAAFNGCIISYARRQVYAQDGEFLYVMSEGGKPRRGAELLNDLKFLKTVTS